MTSFNQAKSRWDAAFHSIAESDEGRRAIANFDIDATNGSGSGLSSGWERKLHEVGIDPRKWLLDPESVSNHEAGHWLSTALSGHKLAEFNIKEYTVNERTQYSGSVLFYQPDDIKNEAEWNSQIFVSVAGIASYNLLAGNQDVELHGGDWADVVSVANALHPHVTSVKHLTPEYVKEVKNIAKAAMSVLAPYQQELHGISVGFQDNRQWSIEETGTSASLPASVYDWTTRALRNDPDKLNLFQGDQTRREEDLRRLLQAQAPNNHAAFGLTRDVDASNVARPMAALRSAIASDLNTRTGRVNASSNLFNSLATGARDVWGQVQAITGQAITSVDQDASNQKAQRASIGGRSYRFRYEPGLVTKNDNNDTVQWKVGLLNVSGKTADEQKALIDAKMREFTPEAELHTHLHGGNDFGIMLFDDSGNLIDAKTSGQLGHKFTQGGISPELRQHLDRIDLLQSRINSVPEPVEPDMAGFNVPAGSGSDASKFKQYQDLQYIHQTLQGMAEGFSSDDEVSAQFGEGWTLNDLQQGVQSKRVQQELYIDTNFGSNANKATGVLIANLQNFGNLSGQTGGLGGNGGSGNGGSNPATLPEPDDEPDGLGAGINVPPEHSYGKVNGAHVLKGRNKGPQITTDDLDAALADITRVPLNTDDPTRNRRRFGNQAAKLNTDPVSQGSNVFSDDNAVGGTTYDQVLSEISMDAPVRVDGSPAFGMGRPGTSFRGESALSLQAQRALKGRSSRSSGRMSESSSSGDALDSGLLNSPSLPPGYARTSSPEETAGTIGKLTAAIKEMGEIAVIATKNQGKLNDVDRERVSNAQSVLKQSQGAMSGESADPVAKALGKRLESSLYGEGGLALPDLKPNQKGFMGQVGDAIKGVADLPHWAVTHRFQLGGILNEFVNPQMQARNQYVQSQAGLAQQMAGYDTLGGANAVAGSSAYASMINPVINQQRAQYYTGKAASQTIGGLMDLGSRSLGDENAANAMSIGQMIAGGAALGSILPGLGTGAGAIGGAAIAMIGQASSMWDDGVRQARVASNFKSGNPFRDFAGAVAYGLDTGWAGLTNNKDWLDRTKKNDQMGKDYADIVAGRRSSGKTSWNTPEGAAFGMQADFEEGGIWAGQIKGLAPEALQKLDLQVKAMYGGGDEVYNNLKTQNAALNTAHGAANIIKTGGDPYALAARGLGWQGGLGSYIEGPGYAKNFDKSNHFYGGDQGAARRAVVGQYGQQLDNYYDSGLAAGDERPDPYGKNSPIDNIVALQAAGDIEGVRQGLKGLDFDTQWSNNKGSSSAYDGMSSSRAGGRRQFLNSLNANGKVGRINQIQGMSGALDQQSNILEIGYGLRAGQGDLTTTAAAAAAPEYASGDMLSKAMTTSRYLGYDATNNDYVNQYMAQGARGIDAARGVGGMASASGIRPGQTGYNAVVDMQRSFASSMNDVQYRGWEESLQSYDQYNEARAQGGYGRGNAAGSMAWNALSTDKQRQIVSTQQTQTGFRNTTGFDIEGSAAYQAMYTAPDRNRAAQIGGNISMAQSAFMQFAGNGAGSQANLDRLLKPAGDMTPAQYSTYIAEQTGNPWATSAMAYAGRAPRNQHSIQMAGGGGTVGLASYTDEAVDSTELRARRTRASGMGLSTSNPYLSMNAYQREDESRKLEYQTRDYDFALQSKQLNRQQASVTGQGLGAFVSGAEGKGAWYFEDQNRELGRSQQDFGRNIQGQKLGLQGQQAAYEYQYQGQQMATQHSHQQQEAQWGIQNLDFQRNQSEVQFGFSQIDADESIRYSRGRDRRVAMRHKEEASVTHSMEMGQIDREEDRAKQRIKWADDLYNKDVSHFEQTRRYQEQNYQLDVQNFQKEGEFIKQQRSLEDQQRAITRAVAVQEMAEAQQSLQIHQQMKIKMDELSAATVVAQRNYDALIASLNARNSGYSAPPQSSGSNAGSSAVPNYTPTTMAQYQQWTQQSLAAMGQPMNSSYSGDSVQVGHTAGHGAYNGGYIGNYYSGGFVRGGYHIPGYADGGLADQGHYTGAGDKYAAAGVTHKGEYVIPGQGTPIIRGDNSETVDALKKILSRLEMIHKDGGNAVINLVGSSGQKVQQAASLVKQAWS